MIPLLIAISGYVCLGAVAILDKHILTESVKRPAVYTFYSTIFFIGIFLLLPFTKALALQHIPFAILSGVAFGLGLWAMFIALEKGEASHISPLVGATVAIATFILSSVFLHEILTLHERIGLIFLICATVLLSFEKSKKYNGFHSGMLWAILAGALFGASDVSSKFIYTLYPFFTGILWTKGTVSLVGIFTLLLPSVRKSLSSKPKDGEVKENHNIPLVISDKALGIVGVLLVQYAIAIGSVTLVNALSGIQYIFMFITIYLLTHIKPKVFSEYFTRKEIFVEFVALLFLVVGLTFLY